MGVPLVDGRDFTPSDATGAPVVLVNETLAKTFYPNQNPIGRRLKPGFSEKTPWFTIVGVVRDVKQGGVDKKTGTELYFLADQGPAALRFAPRNMNVVIRSSLPPESLAGDIRRIVQSMDPTLPIVKLRTMEEVFAETVSRPRFLAQLLGLFAGLALALAAIGTYGILSYTVSERRREIGIHMALGATRTNVLSMILGQGMRLTIVGLVVGVLASFWLTRFLQTQLFNVTPSDPLTLTAVSAALRRSRSLRATFRRTARRALIRWWCCATSSPGKPHNRARSHPRRGRMSSASRRAAVTARARAGDSAHVRCRGYRASDSRTACQPGTGHAVRCCQRDRASRALAATARGPGRQRSASGGGSATVRAGRRPRLPARRGTARRRRHRRCRASGVAAARSAAVPRRPHRRRVVPDLRSRTVPHQSAPRTRPRRGGGPAAADQGAAIRNARPAAGGRSARPAATRAGAHRRPYGLGKERRRWPRSSTRSTAATPATSSRSRTRSSTNTSTSAASSSRWRSAWMRPTFRRRCARRCGRRRT